MGCSRRGIARWTTAPCIARRARWQTRPCRSRRPCSASRGPFRDPWDWGRGLANARDEAQRLQKINQRRPSSSRASSSELADNTDYRTLLGFTKNPRFSGLLTAFTPRGADVIERPVEPDAVRVLIDAGSASGVAEGDAVVVGIDRDRAALVGIVERVNAHSAVVTLITSPDFAIGASVPARQANGIVRPGSDSGLARARRRAQALRRAGQRRRLDERLAGPRRSASSRACRRASRSAS